MEPNRPVPDKLIVKKIFLMIILMGFSSAAMAAEVIPPAPKGKYFNDYANLVSSATASELDRKLLDFEKQTSNQVLIVIYPKMQSDSSIEDYTIRVAQKWGVGRNDRKNGIVLFIFVADHKMYIQVGYGLEGALPDATAKRIIADEIGPKFRSGDYDGGLRAGVNAIIAATRGEYKGTGSTLGKKAVWIGPVVFFIAVFVILNFIRRAIRGTIFAGSGVYRRRGFGGWYGGYGGGSSWGSGGSWGGGGGGSWGGGGGGGGFSAGGGSFGGGGAGGSW